MPQKQRNREEYTANRLPTFDQLMNPLLRALQALGGSGSIEEIYDKVVELECFPEDLLSQLHDAEKAIRQKSVIGSHGPAAT